ncbi:MAG: Hsp70 family protein [Desulfovermiculus sp.]|nr:Hsp70 family protein [Desulfovermiculus sp.]
MHTIFGIDLGTTNSCISRLKEGIPEVLALDGSPLVPSVVSFDPEETIVGSRARNRAVLHPDITVNSVKRVMGSDHTFTIRERTYTPEEISSLILSYLKTKAEETTAEEVKKVVITVPAYFSDAQRRATQKAGQLAGLHVERIINEPTAAALFYTHTLLTPEPAQEEKKVLVYDLGGGTFDVSILRMGELTEVLASSGNTELGGDDFDQALMNGWLDEIMSVHGVDLRSHRPALARLRSVAEQVKITLSAHPFARVDESLIPNPHNKNINLSQEVSREAFEDMIEPFLRTTKTEMDNALSEAGLSASSIDNVLLVGGSTRIPAVISLLEDHFGSSRMPVVDPDLSVAKGAAIQGGIITGSHIHQVLIDVTPHTLSTEALTDDPDMRLKCVPIISRNTQIPVTRSEMFYTVAHEQRQVQVSVYQGESAKSEDNTLIGALDLALTPAPANSPILIEYSYDLNGIIHVKVEQKGYSRKREVDLDSSQRNQKFLELDLEEPDSDKGWEDDIPDEDEETNRNITNYILHKARSVLQNTQDPARHNTLQALITAYEQALQGEDEDEVDEAEEKLVDYLDELENKGE